MYNDRSTTSTTRLSTLLHKSMKPLQLPTGTGRDSLWPRVFAKRPNTSAHQTPRSPSLTRMTCIKRYTTKFRFKSVAPYSERPEGTVCNFCVQYLLNDPSSSFGGGRRRWRRYSHSIRRFRSTPRPFGGRRQSLFRRRSEKSIDFCNFFCFSTVASMKCKRSVSTSDQRNFLACGFSLPLIGGCFLRRRHG